MKARSVPYSMKENIDQEIDRLVTQAILEPIPFTDWATPIVPILKRDNSVRICWDLEVTINPTTKLDCYPIPRIEDLLLW